MVAGLLSLLLIAAGLTMLGLAIGRKPRYRPVPVRPMPVEVLLEPADLEKLLPPVIYPPPPEAQPLGPTDVFKRLRGLALGVPELGPPAPQHAALATAALAAIGGSTAQGQYAPRRPNLLPQLMQAVNDNDLSRRELAAIIARDPSLVGSLLNMANSSYYRVCERPIESIDRAVVLLGSEGIRALIAAAVMQPIFRMSSGPFPRFPEIIWEHALRSANAAVAHAALVEKADPFAAELLSLVAGLADIVLFRALLDQYAIRPGRGALAGAPDPSLAATLAALIEAHAPQLARRIGGHWELSERLLVALDEQHGANDPTTPLGRSLRFGRLAGALAVLQINKGVDELTARASLPAAGLPLPQLERMWTRLTHEPAAPKEPGAARSAQAPAVKPARGTVPRMQRSHAAGG